MSTSEKMFEMISFNCSESDETVDLEELNERSLPNIMKLLGRHPAQPVNLTLPTYSLFYISPLSTFTLLYNLVYFLAFYFMQIHLPLIITFGQSFVQT